MKRFRAPRKPRAPATHNTQHSHLNNLTQTNQQGNTITSKRRGAPLEAVPEAKVARGGAGAGAAAEETWDDISARTGLAPADALSRKLVFKKNTLPAKKVEEIGPVIKELK